ncbi:MAG: hypothetical protein R2734_11705 [Nocardioides sp.]
MSIFGDVFLQGGDGVWYLDSLEGTLTLEWPDSRALEAVLDTAEGQDQYLLGGIAVGAQQRGIVPGPDQILMFSVHPALGGPVSADNVEAMDYVVASSICGQLRRQLKDRPPGALITGVTVDEPPT